MKSEVAILLFAVFHGLPAQSQTTTNGKATASGTCAVSHSGNDDTIIIKNCGIGIEQGNKIIEILKAVLANQDLTTVNAKLDELLKVASRSNPYASVTTYTLDGVKRTENQSTGLTRLDQSGQLDFRNMVQKQTNEDWAGLVTTTQAAITKYPGWFTPFGLLGEAQMKLCRGTEATASLTKFIQDTDGAEAYEGVRTTAQQMLEQVQSPQYKLSCGQQYR
jgi:hypothetical protein